MSQRIAHIWKLRWKNRTEQKAESAKSSLEAFDPEAVLDLAKTKKQKLRRSVKDLYIDLMEVKALSFIVDLWKYLRKSREEKKAELYESSLNAFDALAVLDSKTKQEIRCDVENLYNDLMEINVLQFKVNFIAIPLMVLFLIIAWFFVAGLIIVILGSLLSFLFSTSLNNIQSFLDTQSRNGNVWAAIVAGILYLGGFLLWLRVSFDITAFLLEPILSAYPRFFERLRNTRYPVASLVDKLIWLLHNAERYHTQERLKFDVRPYVTVVKWWQLNSQRKKDFLLVNGFATATDLAERQLNSQRKKDRITHIPYNLFIIATLHEKKCVCYSAGYITERNDKTNELRNIDRLGEPTTNIEKAYRAIETAVLERRVTIKALAPIMPKKPKEVEEKKEKPHNRVKNLIGYKQQQMLLLEGAARCLERYVPRQLRGGDAVTDYWLQETFQLAAAALREKKAWILTPKIDTYDNLTGKIGSTLICAVKDNWDALERAKMGMEELMKQQKLARSQLWPFRLIVLLRSVFVAILPVIGFIIFQLTPLAITGANRTYVIVGLFIWVGLSALALLDSDLEKKLGMANTIKSLLSLPGKEGPYDQK